MDDGTVYMEENLSFVQSVKRKLIKAGPPTFTVRFNQLDEEEEEEATVWRNRRHGLAIEDSKESLGYSS